jgi:hypothetical protein
MMVRFVELVRGAIECFYGDEMAVVICFKRRI